MPKRNRQFAAFIRDRRTAAGLSQSQLAQAVGVTKPSIHYWEQGKVVPGVNMLEPLARALGVSYEDLFVLAGYAHPEGLPDPEPYLRTLFPSVSKKRLAEAKRLFDKIDEEEKRSGKRSKGRR